MFGGARATPPPLADATYGVSLVAPAPARPPAASPLQPETATASEHPTAFRADFKLPFAVSTLLVNGSNVSGSDISSSPFAPVPQLFLGLQTGRVGLGAGIGFTRIGASATSLVASGGLGGGFNESFSLTELLLAPTLTLDAFQSKDGKVALYVLAAPIFGIILESNESAESDLGFQFALGANMALHDNFRLGLEVGPVGHFYNSSGDETFSSISLYTALVGSFLYPR
jgi:hypothetical protein